MTIIMIFKKLPYSGSALYGEKHKGIIYYIHMDTMMKLCLNFQTHIYTTEHIIIKPYFIIYIYCIYIWSQIMHGSGRDKCVSYKHYAYAHVRPGVPLFFGRKWRSCGYYICYIVSYYTYNNTDIIYYICVCVDGRALKICIQHV